MHCSYFCVRLTDGAASIFFFLSLSLLELVTFWSRIIPFQSERKREVRSKKKKKSQKNTSLWPGFKPTTSSPELSVLFFRPWCPVLCLGQYLSIGPGSETKQLKATFLISKH